MIGLIIFLLCIVIILLILKSNNAHKDVVVADSSVFIDGRIYNIIKTNFISFKLVIPSFVIENLTTLSKSSNSVIKIRLAKALSLVNKLKESGSNVRILNISLKETEDMTSKIIDIANTLKGKVLTKDFNVLKEASLKNIKVLNINDLEAALYPMFLPGDNISVYLVKEGAQHNQAIGYFDDKTKIIVEDAKKFIGKDISLVVTSAMFTPTGKIIFGKPSGQIK
jgi:uncharacterized protein YacL